ncbi:hypothetical protein [Kineococcus sp. SYSU DK001]|uniref:hypothetical protein n=1 Tax=Kineococcus sp. SYSU DK001 TaxID=3383122 RepID=UPI003D7F051C
MTNPQSAPAGDDPWRDGEPDPVPFTLGRWAGQVRRGGSLSNLTFDGVDVLRAVRAVVRDRDWRTAPSAVSTLDVRGTDLLLTGTFDDDGGEDAVHGDWTLTARATGDTLTVDFTGTTRTAFSRNRFGLVVLHRTDDAGRELHVRHPDGTSTTTAFPVDIAPHQPARGIAALAWSRPGADVALEFSGDVFEMEDQRNWTDASFKTYSTPLDEPFPVALPAGAVVRQRVVVRATATAAEPAPEPGPVALVASGTALPQWGTTGPVDGFDGPLLVELLLADPAWQADLDRAHRIGRPLDVRLVTDDPDEVRAALPALAGVPVVRLGAHSATRHVTTAGLWDALCEDTSGAERVAGARSHFTELNRTLAQLPPDAAGVVFASTPQMHDTGRDQVVEAVDVQRLTAVQAVRSAAGRPVHVGPVTARARYNAVATTPWRPGRDRTPADPRTGAPAFTAWVVASAAAFAVDGVATVVFGDVEGTGADAVRLLAPLAGRERLDPDGPLPPGVHVLAGRGPDGDRVLVANLGPGTRTVVVGGATFTVAPGAVSQG